MEVGRDWGVGRRRDACATFWRRDWSWGAWGWGGGGVGRRRLACAPLATNDVGTATSDVSPATNDVSPATNDMRPRPFGVFPATKGRSPRSSLPVKSPPSPALCRSSPSPRASTKGRSCGAPRALMKLLGTLTRDTGASSFVVLPLPLVVDTVTLSPGAAPKRRGTISSCRVRSRAHPARRREQIFPGSFCPEHAPKLPGRAPKRVRHATKRPVSLRFVMVPAPKRSGPLPLLPCPLTKHVSTLTKRPGSMSKRSGHGALIAHH
jgi:hypothetical protein